MKNLRPSKELDLTRLALRSTFLPSGILLFNDEFLDGVGVVLTLLDFVVSKEERESLFFADSIDESASRFCVPFIF